MALTVPQVVEKLLDTVNAGKIVTEVGSGLAMGIPMLMLLSLAGEISVLPADRGRDLKRWVEEAKVQTEREKSELRPVLQSILNPPQDLKSADGDALLSIARREIASMAAEVELLDTQIAALLRPQGALPKADIQAVMDQKRPMVVQMDRLVAQKDIIEAAVERQRSLENQLEDSRSFANNMEVFTNNITATLAFSVVLGVVLSQVSRLFFVNLFYDRLVPRATISPAEAVRRGWATQQMFDDLIRGYYRYTEGSINMIGPSLMFGIIFPLYATQRLPDVKSGYLLAASVLAIGSAVSLVGTGYFTYREYRKRVNDLCTEPVGGVVPPPPTQ